MFLLLFNRVIHKDTLHTKFENLILFLVMNTRKVSIATNYKIVFQQQQQQY